MWEELKARIVYQEATACIAVSLASCVSISIRYLFIYRILHVGRFLVVVLINLNFTLALQSQVVKRNMFKAVATVPTCARTKFPELAGGVGALRSTFINRKGSISNGRVLPPSVED